MQDPANRSKQMVADLGTKRLNHDEFQRKCLEWLFEPECWSDINPLAFPVKPQEVDGYLSIPSNERKNLPKSYFQDNPIVDRFYTDLIRIYSHNSERIKTLENFIEYARTEEEHTKLKRRIESFRLVATAQKETVYGIWNKEKNY